MPTSVTSLFREGGFTGKVIHSSDSADFETHVKSKRVLIIGGGYSAEDLALTAIKVAFGGLRMWFRGQAVGLRGRSNCYQTECRSR
jgi:cation diffusion facilitator CzcD-associated flavoprotein CzcO